MLKSIEEIEKQLAALSKTLLDAHEKKMAAEERFDMIESIYYEKRKELDDMKIARATNKPRFERART